MARSYRELQVWQKAMDLVVAVYRLSVHWPKEEQYGLTSQARRSAVSIASNVAEGEGRSNRQDFARFCHIAYSSLQELETQLILSERLGFTQTSQSDPLLIQSAEIARMLNGLIRHLEHSQSQTDH